jgi:hypothetical protein
MMRNNLKWLIVLVLFSTITLKTNAQFEAGASYAGPSLGLSFLGSTFQLGLNYEYGMNLKQIGLDGPGKIGIGGILRYWSYSSGSDYSKWKYTDILIGAQGNYHFPTGSKLDPWIGLVLAYDAGSVSWDGSGSKVSEPTYGGLWLGAHAGIRYWISPTLAATARVGFGTLSYGALDIGVDFKI